MSTYQSIFCDTRLWLGERRMSLRLVELFLILCTSLAYQSLFVRSMLNPLEILVQLPTRVEPTFLAEAAQRFYSRTLRKQLVSVIIGNRRKLGFVSLEFRKLS